MPKNGENDDEKTYSVVQPDICIVCDLSKLDDRGCVGAPDLIVEIISPSSAQIDVHDKFNLYEKHGVREYWIAYPEDKTLTVFVLNGSKYEFSGMYAGNSVVKVSIFDDLEVDLKDIFDY